MEGVSRGAGGGATSGGGIDDARGARCVGIDGGRGTSGSRRDDKTKADEQAEGKGRSGGGGTHHGERDRVSSSDIAVVLLGPETPAKKRVILWDFLYLDNP